MSMGLCLTRASRAREPRYKSGHESQGILDFVHIAFIEWIVPDNCKDRFRGFTQISDRFHHRYHYESESTYFKRCLRTKHSKIVRILHFTTNRFGLSAKLSAEVSSGFECWVIWNSTSLSSCFTWSFPASPKELFDFPKETVIASYKFKSILILWIRLTDKRRVGASKTEIIKNRLSWNYNFKYHQYSVSILSN